eukprot:6564324-Alexandrium_andersonii.AAC.1
MCIRDRSSASSSSNGAHSMASSPSSAALWSSYCRRTSLYCDTRARRPLATSPPTSAPSLSLSAGISNCAQMPRTSWPET